MDWIWENITTITNIISLFIIPAVAYIVKLGQKLEKMISRVEVLEKTYPELKEGQKELSKNIEALDRDMGKELTLLTVKVTKIEEGMLGMKDMINKIYNKIMAN